MAPFTQFFTSSLRKYAPPAPAASSTARSKGTFEPEPDGGAAGLDSCGDVLYVRTLARGKKAEAARGAIVARTLRDDKRQRFRNKAIVVVQ